MIELVFATNNKNKLMEAEQIMPEGMLLLNLDDIGCNRELPETADTLEDNAMMKAKSVHDEFECNCFADDTGLEVEALDGAPGVYSARYAGTHGDSEANMSKLLKELEGKENRNARFRTVIALIIDGKSYSFEGEVKGRIARNKQGDKGFGYDPIFIPEGGDISFAEMPSTDKNAISHRGRALQKMQEFLNQYS